MVLLDDPTPLPRYQMDLLVIQRKAVSDFYPKPYPGKVTVFTALYPTVTKAFTSALDSAQGWENLALGGVKVHFIKSAHRNIHLPPYCYELAEKLEKDLQEADAA